MASTSIRSQAYPKTSGIVSPMWREDALESRHEVNISAVGYRPGQGLQLLRTFDEPNSLGPMNCSSCDFDGSFKCILRRSVYVVAQRRQESMFRLHWLWPRVLEQEAASTVSILDLSLSKNMAQASGMLVAHDSRYWHTLDAFQTFIHCCDFSKI